jgi:hypothetical protein
VFIWSNNVTFPADVLAVLCIGLAVAHVDGLIGSLGKEPKNGIARSFVHLYRFSLVSLIW